MEKNDLPSEHKLSADVSKKPFDVKEEDRKLADLKVRIDAAKIKHGVRTEHDKPHLAPDQAASH